MAADKQEPEAPSTRVDKNFDANTSRRVCPFCGTKNNPDRQSCSLCNLTFETSEKLRLPQLKQSGGNLDSKVQDFVETHLLWMAELGAIPIAGLRKLFAKK